MRSPRKLTALVLMGALTATSVAAVPASAKTFSDVPSNHWAYTVIDEVSNENIMVGVGNGLFAPSMQLTRAQYTAILSNLAPDKSNGTYEAHLTDVDAGAWYAEVAEWGVTNGIIYEIDGRFEGNTVLTREEMASMTLQYLNLYYKDSIKQDNSSAGYADESSINPKYLNAVNLLSNNGLLAGRGDNKFEPAGTLTRAEAAAMAARLMDVADKAGTTTPEDPDEEQPPAEDPEQPPVDPDEPEQPSEDPDEEKPPVEEPSDPDEEQPPAEDPDKDPAEDPNDPANWDLDGAPKWFLVGQPDNISDDLWYQLITYYADKECPANSNYPSSIKDLPSDYQHNEKLAKEFCGARMDDLISIMQRDLAGQAISMTTTLSSSEQEMVDLINKERTAEGASELKVSKALCEAARIRAKEAITNFEHKRPDGSDTKTVLQEVGLKDYLGKYYGGNANIDYYGWGENLTRRSKGDFPVTDAFSNFMNSSSHKENMINAEYEFVGVGSYTDGTKTVWCQLFSNII